MKKIILVSSLFYTTLAFCQNEKTSSQPIPSVDLKNMIGQVVKSSSFSNDGKPFVIDFWATWCKPCIEELNAINEVYADWQKETGVKVIIISLDDAKTMSRVAPFVNGRRWTYESYIDPNADFKRAMNVNMPPQTFVVDGKGNIVWQHVGFVEGNEDEIFEVIKKVAAGKPIN